MGPSATTERTLMPEIRVGDENSAPISIHYEDVG
jgi:hypothetical protein